MGNTLSVRFSTDSEGFLSQECPSCKTRFKVRFGEGSDQPIAFCPYCDHNGKDCWWTPEQAEYMSATVGSEVVGPELDKMAREFNRKTRGRNNLISMSMKVSHSEAPIQPDEPEEAWMKTRFQCCDETIKHQEGEHLRCIICGSSSQGISI